MLHLLLQFRENKWLLRGAWAELELSSKMVILFNRSCYGWGCIPRCHSILNLKTQFVVGNPYRFECDSGCRVVLGQITQVSSLALIAAATAPGMLYIVMKRALFHVHNNLEVEVL